MRILLTILIVLFYSIQLFSQKDSIKKPRYQCAYLEVGGPSTIASLNYEIGLIQFEHLNINARIGFGATRFQDFNLKVNPDYTIPIGLNGTFPLFNKKKGILKVELMVGNTISSYVRVNSEYNPQREFDNHGFTSIGPSWTFGKGIYTRLNYCLILDKYKTPFHWGGLSLGYKFK